ncbi:hypothetical protein DFH08DRAFT_1088525 [Mycena albidolilacea]|uniref:Uncharacterized protein n=1 Tax=Mycena albidolilacea TaxID=1033008 RepID=A0AAD7EB17_9AGAR|nr:hypothetical protein DFH08DRAFT_1088525 [Mycena albidolilacea]
MRSPAAFARSGAVLGMLHAGDTLPRAAFPTCWLRSERRICGTLVNAPCPCPSAAARCGNPAPRLSVVRRSVSRPPEAHALCCAPTRPLSTSVPPAFRRRPSRPFPDAGPLGHLDGP